MDELEQQIKALQTPEPDAALYGAVMAQFEARHQGSLFSILWPFGPVWQPAVSLMVVALLGFVYAPQLISETDTQLASLDFDTLILGESYSEEVQP